MKFLASPLCSLAGVIFIGATANAAITVADRPPEQSVVEESQFSEGGANAYEKERRFRLEERRRAQSRSRMLLIAAIAAPIALVVIGALVYVHLRARNKRSSHRSLVRELKRAEARRRAGGPPVVLDPRQW